MKKGFIVLGKQTLKVAELAFSAKPPIKNGKLEIRMLSPLTVYSTLTTPDGKKKTYYFSPYEKEFSALVNSNVKKKHFLLFGRNIKSDIKIEPLRVREVIVVYKGTVVKGWVGRFLLRGPKTLIQVAYETGLGAKNSQGLEQVNNDIEFVKRAEEVALACGYRPIELCWMTWLIQPEGKRMRMEKYSSILSKI